MAPHRLLYAITGHGYGHATRSLEVARVIRGRFPEVDITFSTLVPRDFLERFGGGPLEPLPAAATPGARPGGAFHRRASYEPGTSDRTAFEVDPAATRASYRRFQEERPRRLRDEELFLRQGGYTAVVSDIAALPIAAAARAGLPAAAISNFTWDWILSPLLAEDPAVAGLPGVIAGDYRPALLYLRLPFHPEEHPFRRVEDVPLLGRKAALPGAEVRRLLGLGEGPLVLLTMGGLGPRGLPPIRVEGLADIQFMAVGGLPVEIPGSVLLRLEGAPPAGVRFPDLVGAADVVLGKPGYGITSECAANGTPLLCVERKGFAEAAALRHVGRLVPFAEMGVEDFLAGRWEPHLRELLRRHRAPPCPADGAAACAERLGALFAWSRGQ